MKTKIINITEFEVLRADKNITDVEYLGYSKEYNSDDFILWYGEESVKYTVEYTDVSTLKKEVQYLLKKEYRIKSDILKEEKESLRINKAIELIKELSYPTFDLIADLEKLDVHTCKYLKTLRDDLLNVQYRTTKLVKKLKGIK